MLGIDCNTNIIGHYSTPSASSHYRDDNITRKNSIPGELLVFFLCYETLFCPTKLIANSIINTKYGDAGLHKLAMEQLTAERTCANRVLPVDHQISDGAGRKLADITREHIKENGSHKIPREGK